MDIDELIFERISGYFRRRKKRTKDNSAAVFLDDIRSRLLLMARAFSGMPVEIFPAEREGGYRDLNYFLPSSLSLFPTYEENLSLYFFRVLYLSIQAQLNLNFSDAADHTLEEARMQARGASVRIIGHMRLHHAPAFELHEALLQKLKARCEKPDESPDTSWLYGKWMNNGTMNGAPDLLKNTGDAIREALKREPVTTVTAKPVEEITTVTVDQKQQEDYVLTHNFEKVETAEEFDGLWRDFDGDDEMDKHRDAIDELNMKFTVRVDDPAHSVYQADFVENVTVSESAGKDHDPSACILYPEWEHAKQRYLPGYCRVFPIRKQEQNQSYYRETMCAYRTVMTGIRKMLTDLNNKLSRQRMQTDGPEFDLDALTDHYTDIHSRHTPSDKIYLSNRKREKSISILLLLDTSLSSDGYVDGNRVIDVEKQVAILFGEILEEFGIGFSVAGFHSKTRNFLHYNVLKDFNEMWDDAKYRIGAAEPAGYTRIGAAIRHAGNELRKQESKNKWIILLSDGKPNDYDRYEGRHGIHDVKQALRELNEYRIHSFALAIEARARYYLPQMFGQNHYRILSSVDELIRALVALFERIKYHA